ncbi:epimerase [Alteribacter lacisalsi]|uniref:Epimerase n=1 Tax=Alteribacter lacisalsi TaxID=2045244 RepID=A0A2W0H8S8_9BACI|nr:NAD-dependent epimerase/dehydratase family protein [Alteribacter lacisalsi]PYZ97567.1 epimerase [Alteribacter lacisalsi]
MTQLGNILVTGGAGFLGSQLVLRLLPHAAHIWVLDDLSTGTLDAIPLDPKVTFVRGSILDRNLLKKLLPNVEYVFHFACANLINSVSHIDQDFETNLTGGFTMLHETHLSCPQLKRFVYASTASVYSQADILPTPETYSRIRLPYPASKFGVEHYCHVFHHLYGMPVTTLRFSNVYGPGQLSTNPYCGVVAKFFDAAETGIPMAIFGDGKQTRDFTYVEDAVEAIWLAALSPDAPGEVFNVGTGKETSVLELAHKIRQLTGYTGKITHMPKRVVDIVNRRCLDHSFITSRLAWTPRSTIDAGLEKTRNWLKSRRSD